MTEATYLSTAPNGVTVISCVPLVEHKWWDQPYLHLVWSYGSWVSWILLENGHPGMRRYLAKRGWWKSPSKRKTERWIRS